MFVRFWMSERGLREDEEGAALLNAGTHTQDEIARIWAQHSTSYRYDKAGRLTSQTNALNQTNLQ